MTDGDVTFATDIEQAAAGPLEAVVIAAMQYGDDERHRPADEVAGRVLTWAEARPLLDYTYDTGYGAADCHAVFAWTADRVVLVHEYDGSTSLTWVPRHPVPCEPVHGGMWNLAPLIQS